MPELPDLEVIRECLAERLPGMVVAAVEVRRPLVVRNLLGGEPRDHLAGRRFATVSRRGKFLLLAMETGVTLVINPMLAGRLRYGIPVARRRTRDAVVLTFADGSELSYHDSADMGKIYLTVDVARVPGFAGQGPEADDPNLTLALFRERLRHHTGEIKGILTNQGFVAGIGNAYADEILWSAGIYPFRRRADLTAEEVEAVHASMRLVLANAIAALRVRVGAQIDVEVRDFLSVHGKPGTPCPRCATTISEVRRARVATHFCRACQPGLMVDRRKH